jgi:large subunit ribosomal protein L17
MRHRKTGKQLDRSSSVRAGLMRDLATSLLIFEHITTTQAKAKTLRPYAEKLITIAKRNDVQSRRALMQVLRHEKAINKALEVIGPRYRDRRGGYTRITTTAPRLGDGAQMAVIELV